MGIGIYIDMLNEYTPIHVQFLSHLPVSRVPIVSH